MDNHFATSADGRAKAIAEALSRGGITNDDPDLTYNPIDAARYAYGVMFEGATSEDFHDYAQKPKEGDGRGHEYHRRLTAVCKNALERVEASPSDRERLSYALGYFEGIARAIRDGAEIHG